MGLDLLEFDTTDAANSDNVGAYMLAGTDGDAIESTVVNSKESLNVAAALFSGAGVAITETSGAMDVNISSADINVAIDFEYAEDAASSGGETFASVGGIRQDTLATSTSADGDYTPFKVNAEGSLYTATTLSPPNTAFASAAVSIDTTVGGVAIPASPLANRKTMIVQNEGNTIIYLGPSGLTTSTGLALGKRKTIELELGPSALLFGIVGSGTQSVRAFEQS